MTRQINLILPERLCDKKFIAWTNGPRHNFLVTAETNISMRVFFVHQKQRQWDGVLNEKKTRNPLIRGAKQRSTTLQRQWIIIWNQNSYISVEEVKIFKQSHTKERRGRNLLERNALITLLLLSWNRTKMFAIIEKWYQLFCSFARLLFLCFVCILIFALP